MDSDRSGIIRQLNDDLRCKSTGGQILVTADVQALGDDRVSEVLKAVSAFDAFDEENDPDGEHDCAIMTVGATEVLWKIDYYDLSMEFGSDDPTNPCVTTRVLTIMLSDEY